MQMKRMNFIFPALFFTFFSGIGTISAETSCPGIREKTCKDGKNMKIVVMSDIHVMAPELLKKEGKAYSEYIAGDRKLLKESSAILEAAVAEILKQKPDAVLVTGDLTKDGEYVSHELVSGKLLRPLAANGIRTFVIPGNHDINNPHAAEYDGDTSRRVRTVTPEEFAAFYGDYGYGEALARDTASLSYVAQLDGNVRLLAVDACRYEDNDFAKNVSVVGGRIKDATMDFIISQARKAEQDGCRMLTMIHHGIVRHWKWEDKAMADYLVADWKKCRRIFSENGLNVVFSGHFHAQDISVYGKGKTAVYDIETGSTVSYPLPVRNIVLDGDSMAITTWHISPLMKDSSLDDKAVHYAREAIASIVRGLTDGALPHDIVEEAAAVAGDAYVAHIRGDESMTEDDMKKLKAAVRKVRKHSFKYAFILDHIVRYLHTDQDNTGDNDCIISPGRADRSR